MTDILARIARDMRVTQLPTGARAYAQLVTAAEDGTAINLSDHELVMAVSRAVWNGELALAALGLSELELRTSLDAVHHQEERQAA